MDDSRVRAAAIDNACWCDAFCSSHGQAGTFRSPEGGVVPPKDAAMWSSPVRTPVSYPDAVTLTPEIARDDVLGRIDASPGCSVKDSFAALDLRPAGFAVLAEASWIWLDESIDAQPGVVVWRRVRGAAELRRWEAGWAGSEGASGAFRGTLLRHEKVAIMAGYRSGLLVAGGVLTRTGGVVGMSNVFVLEGDPAEERRGLGRAAGLLWGPRPLVGYESGPDLDVARAAGFQEVGRLSIWLRNS